MSNDAERTKSDKWQIGGSWIQAMPEHLERWRRGEPVGPLVAEVAPAGGCNHNCLHCAPQQFKRYSDTQVLLRKEAFEAFLRDFKTLGGVEIFFAGNGEPLLNPDVASFTRTGRELGLSMAISTNGVLFRGETMEELVSSMRWIRLSVNGGDAATYARVHRCPESDFHVLLENIEKAVAFRARRGGGARLIIQFLAYQPNARSIPGLVDLHKRLGTDVLRVRNAFFKNKSDPLNGEAETAAQLDALEGVEGVEVRRSTFDCSPPLPAWTRCRGIHFRTNVDDRGGLFTCQGRTYFDAYYGNIHEDSFKNIWNSQRKKDAFARIGSGEYRAACHPGCGASVDNTLLHQLCGDHE